MSTPAATTSPAHTTHQYAALAGTVVLSAVLGIWAYFLPQAFFDHFPIVLGEWVSTDGPFNEHLVRDHGAMYLALGAVGVYGLVRPSLPVYRVLGIVWVVFGVLHFAYHVGHLDHLGPVEAAAQLIALVVALGLGIAMLIPGRRQR
ncbi:hypothetical protein ACFOE1_15615 [Agromyces mediolanus]|uniref:Uncharacterized protein n=1 Tax=Agromyces mediolanus TaxID=41986 RepID=A0A918CFV3_AGRME|nr:hypothetical protein [Agromyces mediolanus]GGR23086.1 hypothetical protein GCM10010196_16080 [Agromyces mediolanus]GLJ71134.1 hypothetical protein GCM10017583_03890 [Agromyces mediolanus]